MSLLLPMVGLYSQDDPISSIDILDDKHGFSKKKEKSLEEDKVSEAYEDTEFKLNPNIPFMKEKRDFSPPRNSEKEKMEAGLKEEPTSGKDKNVEIYGGLPGSLGGILANWGHGFQPKAKESGLWKYSVLKGNLSAESREWIGVGKEKISNSEQKKINTGLESLTLLENGSLIQTNISFLKKDIGMQGNSYYDASKKTGGEFEASYKSSINDAFRQKIILGYAGLDLEHHSYPALSGKNDSGKRFDYSRYFSSYDMSYLFKEMIGVNAGVKYYNHSFHSGLYPQTSVVSDEKYNVQELFGRVGVFKPSDGVFLKRFGIRMDYLTYESDKEKKNAGGDFTILWKFKGWEFGLNHLQSARIADVYKILSQTDFTLPPEKILSTRIRDDSGYIEYQNPDYWKIKLTAGRKEEYNSYLWHRNREGMYQMEGRDYFYDYINAQLNLKLGKNINIGMDGMMKKVNPFLLPYLPAKTGKTFFEGKYKIFRLRLDHRYKSSRYSDSPKNKLPEEHLTDLSLYLILTQNFEFHLTVRNLRDVKVRVFEEYLDPGRQILFGIRGSI